MAEENVCETNPPPAEPLPKDNFCRTLAVCTISVVVIVNAVMAILLWVKH
jgi:hypothetical protein